MRFDVLTLFPEMFSGYLGQSLLKLAIRRGLVEVQLHNIRDWAHGRHRMVDDRPFGGGPGMVLKPEPVVECVESVQAGKSPATAAEAEDTDDGSNNGSRESDRLGTGPSLEPGHLVMLTPQGRRLTQPIVEELASHNRLVLLCGRYEGFDDRVREILRPDEISIGDYILGGGETAAIVVIDAVIRLVPEVLGHEQSPVGRFVLGEAAVAGRSAIHAAAGIPGTNGSRRTARGKPRTNCTLATRTKSAKDARTQERPALAMGHDTERRNPGATGTTRKE